MINSIFTITPILGALVLRNHCLI